MLSPSAFEEEAVKPFATLERLAKAFPSLKVPFHSLFQVDEGSEKGLDREYSLRALVPRGKTVPER